MKGLPYFASIEEQCLDEKSVFSGSRRQARRSIKVWFPFLAAILITLPTLSLLRFDLLAHKCHDPEIASLEYDYAAVGTSDNATEAFELLLPILYKNLVHEEEVLHHTFGNSWGIPAKSTFTPPKNQTFNRVVLRLNTTVDGVQYDRLAHVFIDDVPVWRTSTAEPGNHLTFSSTTKDITKYLPLFLNTDDEVEVTLKLDNLVRGRLTGAFETSLSVQYYYEAEEKEKEPSKVPNDVSSYFTVTSKPSQRITRLLDSSNNRSPLLYYPTDELSFEIPKINSNTTNLKLALYASGNAAEEFWYSNVLDKNQDIFESKGHSFLGHGPVRVINVYVDGILISSVAPPPVIFTGGISPALWRPIVGVNAFDIKPIEIDLTVVLPILWKKASKLDIEILNGDYKDNQIGQNWIIGANLLHWESNSIQSSFGEIEDFKNSSYYSSFSISTATDNLYQTVVSNHTVDIFSNLTYNLYNGSQIPLKIHSSTDSRFSNFQEYSNFGDSQFLSTVISISHSSKIYHQGEKVGDLKTNKVYPLVISIETEPIDKKLREVTYDTNITNVYGSNILINDVEVFALESRHLGTSTFTLSPNGNHGFGTAYVNLAAELQYPFPVLKVDEVAEAVNGTVTKRESANDAASSDAIFDLSQFNHVQMQALKVHLESLIERNAISESVVYEFLKDWTLSNDHFEKQQLNKNGQVSPESLKHPHNIISLRPLDG